MSQDKIRIFVGCPANGEDLEWQMVLEYALRKHHSQDDLEIHWMMLSRDPKSFWFADPPTRRGWITKGWPTPFTALRWGIPEFCEFKGKAIYTDSDVIPLDDIANLWNQDVPKGVLAKFHGARGFLPCVMLMDCAKLKNVMPRADTLRKTPGKYLNVPGILKEHVTAFNGDWNCRDGDKYERPLEEAKLIHFTKIPMQPNHKYARHRLGARPHWYPGPDLPHPRPELQALFDRTYADAKRAGYAPEKYAPRRQFGNYGRGKADKVKAA